MMVLGGAGIMILDKTHHLQSSTRYQAVKCRLHYNPPVVLYYQRTSYQRTFAKLYLFVEESVVFVFTFSVFTVHLALCLNRFNKQKALNRSGLLQAWHCATSRRLVDSSTVQDDQHPDAGARPGLPPPRTLRSLLLLPDQVAWLP